ncbi:RNA pyrophosphohydrolase [Rhodospirillales bacterium TMPK1]|uniref:RNA pyrophosphohydrolase n=1 Tax=Roseiterribacter gracilis TaxID=2812848 RepID=A0A8S8XET1_9PROT|nr:RNA pyrophosphohydrolase [Rhodospirillales bacterium TMPK1]
MTDDTDRFYRPNVGVALFNRDGKVLVARRRGSSDAWQMPQGGVHDDEDLEQAARRELAEEVGVRSAELLGRVEEWLRYDLPAETLANHRWKGKWKGQRQAWLAMRFTGPDSEIDLTVEKPPEFDAWKWVALADVPLLIVPFKRAIYERVARDFARFTQPV